MRPFAQGAARRIARLALVLLLAGCTPPALLPSADTPISAPAEATELTSVPDATPEDTPIPGTTRYRNSDLGVTLRYPKAWTPRAGEQQSTLTWLAAPSKKVQAMLFYKSMPAGATLAQVARKVREATASQLKDVKPLVDGASTLADGRAAWRGEYTGKRTDGSTVQVLVASTMRSGHLFTLMAFGNPDDMDSEREALDQIIASIKLETPQIYGSRDQALVRLGGESNNPRAYDPATGGGDDLVFSGLVTFHPQLAVVPTWPNHGIYRPMARSTPSTCGPAPVSTAASRWWRRM